MHEKAAICRAAENTIYFGTVNYALPNSIDCTAMTDPDRNISKKHSSGNENVLVVDIAPLKATGLLAKTLSASEYPLTNFTQSSGMPYPKKHLASQQALPQQNPATHAGARDGRGRGDSRSTCPGLAA